MALHAGDTINAVDLFCGAGGLTRGLLDGGVHVVAGLDTDPLCRYPYEKNNKTRFVHANVSTLHGKDVARLFPSMGIKLLAGCAPCQPFSPLGRTRVLKRPAESRLLIDFARIVNEVKPDLVLME